MSSTFNRLQKIEIVGYKQNKEGHTEYSINAYFSENNSPIQFKSRYSSLLELHKAIMQYNKKDSLPLFPGKNIFGTKSQDLINKRLKDLNDYFENLFRIPQLGGISIIIFFIQNQSNVLKEFCQKLQVKNKIEMYKYYSKERKQYSSTFNSKVYKLVRDNSAYVLKKYGLDEEIRDSQGLEGWRYTIEQYSQKINKLKYNKNISRPEQIIINHEPNGKCRCKNKEFYTKLWIVNPLYENTLDSEINLRHKNNRSFQSKEIIELLKQVMQGLEFLYNNQLYHRNLKPTNIGIIKEVNQQKQQRITYTLMDYHDVLFYKKEKSMINGNADTNRYSINLAYKSPRRVAQIRQTNNSKNRDEDYKNFDMYALGIILLQVCLALPTQELQGFQEVSQLRDDMINNYLSQIRQKYDENIYDYISILLNKSALNNMFSSNQQQQQLQKFSAFDIVYSKLFARQQDQSQVSPLLNNENNISSTKALSDQSTTYGNSAQDIENNKQIDQEQMQEKQTNLEYADECFIIKFQPNLDNILIQKKTQHILRVLLSDNNLSDNQVKEQFKCITEPGNFRGYAALSLAKNDITDDLGEYLREFISSLEQIESISFDLRDIKKISAPLILQILQGISKRKTITQLMLDISQCPQITPQCINSIITTASQISHLLQFSLYFFNSNLNEESLQQIEINSKQYKSAPFIKFMYTF